MPIVIVVLATVVWWAVCQAAGLPDIVTIAGGPLIGWVVARFSK
ncbi:hypothetical protein [Cupriavidus gilardii]|nr:hypothetical protein [Cupriavidus gilardii]UXC34794.1 hypothetical protein N4G38_10105 [Cupriavidus gilardii]